jgi:hypothetical protein
MNAMNDEPLDRGIREALEPDREAVRRVAQGALRPNRQTHSAARLAIAAAATLSIVAAATCLLTRNHEQPAAGRVQMTNVGETVVVKPASGAVVLVGAARSDADRLPAGTIIVFRGGEVR